MCSISGKVDNSVKQMGRLLSEIKGGGQGQAISKSGEINVERVGKWFSTHGQMVLQMSRRFYA
jgi:predicted AAA+ superfamily ATPase